MLRLGTEIFIRESGNSCGGYLHSGKVVEAQESMYTAEFEEDVPGTEVGQEVFVYYHHHRAFMQQPIRIEAFTLAQGEQKPTVTFELSGEPISAEDRQCYRVSTVVADMTVRLADEPECPLLDVSVAGFAVLATTLHGIGETVVATLRFEGEEYAGRARIQSVREMEGGSVRYGLNGLRKSEGGGELLRGMEVISAAVQRQQLRRLARVS